jgi:predicted deacylase
MALVAQTVSAPVDILDVAAGTRQMFRFPVTRRASGEQLAITVHVAQGARPGPRLALVGTVHGDAIFGAQVIREVLEHTPLDQLRGTLIAVPVANPIAFESFTRTTGQGMNTDMNNMNRVFPGDRNGWLSQKMAAVVADVTAKQCDAMIDYHCGADTFIDYTLINGEDTEQEKRNFDFAGMLGTKFLFVHKSNPFGGTLTDYVRSLGKLAVVSETGAAHVPEGFLDKQLERAHNIMKALGMLDGAPRLPEQQWLMRTRIVPRCADGGLYIPQLGNDVVGSSVLPGGTVFAKIVDPHTFEDLQVMQTRYERSVLLMMRNVTSRVCGGDYAAIDADYDSGAPMPKPTTNFAARGAST